MDRRDIAATAAAALLLTLTSGCAWFGGDRNDAADPVAAALDTTWEGELAREAVRVLAQLDGNGPDDRTLRFARDALEGDGMVAAVEDAAREAGYAVRVLAGEGASDVVSHDVQSVSDTPPEVRDHTLSMGDVQFRRRYARRPDGGWEAAGPLLVRGADPRGVQLDGTRSPTERTDVPDTRPRPGADGGLTADAPRPSPPSSSPAVAAEAERAAGPRAGAGPARADVPPLDIDPLTGKPVYGGLTGGSEPRGPLLVPRNIAEIGESNYSGLFEAYGNVDEVVLIFPNDSLQLGTYNKGVIRETLERFDPDTDVFSIVGCSLGPTRRENGNEGLALGRANRVKEELLFAGVPAERILDEGCWAGESSARFPARGVVMTLKRQSGPAS